jgi:hypothetical protein
VEKDDAIFHTLPVTKVHSLHCAEHTPNTPRLACVVADAIGTIQWHTFGLSDFIRPSKD